MTTALYLGRFQPFHKGHLQLIIKTLEVYNKVVIGLCSSQKYGTKRNPFKFYDRYHMIRNTLLGLNEADVQPHRWEIIPMPDIEDPPRWAQYVHAIFGDYDVVITNNPNTKDLFESIGDKVKGFPNQSVEVPRCNIQIPYMNKVDVCGTMVREWIVKDRGDDCYKYLVPDTVYFWISRNHLDKELIDIYARDM